MTFIWEGNGAGTKSAVNDGRNWAMPGGGNYAQARYPGSVAGVLDDVEFSSPLASGALSPAGIDLSAGEVWRSLRVGSAYDGSVGSAVTYLEAPILETYLDASGVAAPAGIYVDNSLNGGTGQTVLVEGGANIYLRGYLIGFLARKGSLTIANPAPGGATTTLVSARFSYKDNQVADVVATIEDGVTVSGPIYQDGGTITCRADLGALSPIEQNGGICYSYGDVASRVENYAGDFVWMAGNIYSAYAYASFDGSQSDTERWMNQLLVGPVAVVALDNGQNNIHIRERFTTHGGQIGLPPIPWQAQAVLDIPELLQAHTGQTGTNEHGYSDPIEVQPYDHIQAVCIRDSEDAAIELLAAEDDSQTDEEAIATAASYRDAVGAPTALAPRLAIWGHDLPAGKPWVRVHVQHTSGSDTTASVVIERRRL